MKELEREQTTSFHESKRTFTLRLSDEQNESIKELSEKIGISQNALILLFIDLGKESYKNIILHNQEEFYHFLSQIQK